MCPVRDKGYNIHPGTYSKLEERGRDRYRIDIEQTPDDLQCSASLSVNHDTSNRIHPPRSTSSLSSLQTILVLPPFRGEVKPALEIHPTFVSPVNFNNRRLLASSFIFFLFTRMSRLERSSHEISDKLSRSNLSHPKV